MRRVDAVKNKKMKNIKFIEIIDKKRLRIAFRNDEEIVVAAHATDFGYDSAIYIEEDNV
ncbi:hypothetical protein [Bacillus atrophaeus]|uniref:hypothetical protein n=1 Tax=Bacillus atrophaeus TaxID=1452 RepID=UPI002E1AF75B|nr:hypothetical protein [Bacillus atrophaeus]